MNQTADRRCTRRASMLLPAELRLASCAEEPLKAQARIIDISPSGLRLRLVEEPDARVGDQVFVRVEESCGQNFMNLQGRVRWLRLAEDRADEWELGVKLTGMAIQEWDPWLDLLAWHSETELTGPERE